MLSELSEQAECRGSLRLWFDERRPSDIIGRPTAGLVDHTGSGVVTAGGDRMRARSTIPGLREGPLNGRQHQLRPQAAPRHLIALRRTKARTVVIDDDAHDRGAIASFGHHFDADPHLRPLAGVVYEVADHLFQVLPLTAEAHVGRWVEIDGDAAALMDLLHGAG